MSFVHVHAFPPRLVLALRTVQIISGHSGLHRSIKAHRKRVDCSWDTSGHGDSIVWIPILCLILGRPLAHWLRAIHENVAGTARWFLCPTVHNQRGLPANTRGSTVDIPVPQPESGSRWDTQFKRGILLLILILVIFLLWLARRVLPLMIAAGLLSYILNPIVNFASGIRLPRGVVTFIVYLLLLAVLVLGSYAMMPIIDQQYQTVLRIGANFLELLRDQNNQIPDTIMLFDVPLDLSGIRSAVEPWFSGASVDVLPTLQEMINTLDTAFASSEGANSNLFRGTLDFGLGVINTGVSILLSALFIFVVSLYLTKDAPRIREFVVGNFPSRYQAEWVSLIRCIGNLWHAFFWGQVILSLTVCILAYVTLSILGVQGALILALIAGALEIIPNLGPIISMIPAILVGLTTGSTTFPEMNHVVFALVIVAAYFVMQQLENNTIVPRLIGRFVNIHPILVICGVTVGYLSNGVMGAFLAAPLMGSARVLGTYVFAKLMDYPVSFPETRSNLPLREYDISIQVHKEAPSDTGDDGDAGPTSSAEDSTDLPVVAEPDTLPVPPVT